MDKDTDKLRYMSESSNASTSGYSTMSPNGHLGNGLSPASSTYSSPVSSPRAATLNNDLSNMHLPSNTSLYQQPMAHTYMPMQSASQPPMVYASGRTYMDLGSSSGGAGGLNDTVPMVAVPMDQGMNANSYMSGMFTSNNNMHGMSAGDVTQTMAELEILEQPVEKFRFRYKSEMHGTHGSLNGANSKRTPKTFPEVKLKNFNGRALIRCSLFQWNLESPHSHLLVVRKDENDITDPHEVQVSSKDGYVATFQNMGIIHTAKKNIFEELLRKKSDRMKFLLNRDRLSTKQEQTLRKETEKETKDMDLNKLRLCFEAYKIEDNNTFTLIAGPVYSNPINNRKSAQTGELRICRLSHSSGSVLGGEDLILLVEKVNKKNIKVRFFEKNEDDETTWEEYAKFRESDVHHQYAIVCQTPPYNNKDIEKEVEVYVELVRPTDDERSDPPRQFRYKPREAIVSRKRRRTNSSAFSSGSSLSSLELPKTVQEQTANLGTGIITNSFDFNKSEELKHILGNDYYTAIINTNSEELTKYCTPDFEFGDLQTDGVATTSNANMQSAKLMHLLNSAGLNLHLLRIIKIHEEYMRNKNRGGNNDVEFTKAASLIADIYNDYVEKNGDTILHEIIVNDNDKHALRVCQILEFFHLTELLNRHVNQKNESILHCACLHDRCQYIRALLRLGCDPNAIDNCGNTAMHVAIREQHHKCAESLLNMCDKNVQLNLSVKNDEGLTSLHLAIKFHNTDIAERLLKYDEKVALVSNAKDGNTALHMAIQNRNLRIVKAIMDTNIKEQLLHAKNAANQTPIDFAQVGDEIWHYLRPFVKDVDLGVTIKEEEMSSSSYTDDEDDNNECASANSIPLELVKVKEECEIKHENENDLSKSTNKNSADTLATTGSRDDMLKLLNNSVQFQALVDQLSEEGRWKILAEKLKYNHLICLWSNADDMLTYLRQKNMENIEYSAFVSALRQVLGVDNAASFV